MQQAYRGRPFTLSKKERVKIPQTVLKINTKQFKYFVYVTQFIFILFVFIDFNFHQSTAIFNYYVYRNI